MTAIFLYKESHRDQLIIDFIVKSLSEGTSDNCLGYRKLHLQTQATS